MGWDTSLYPRLLQAISSLALSISRFSGQYPPRTTTFTAKNFFLISYPNLCFVCVKLFPLFSHSRSMYKVHLQLSCIYLYVCLSIFPFPCLSHFITKFSFIAQARTLKLMKMAMNDRDVNSVGWYAPVFYRITHGKGDFLSTFFICSC